MVQNIAIHRIRFIFDSSNTLVYRDGPSIRTDLVSSTLEFDLSVRVPSNVLKFDFDLVCSSALELTRLFEYPRMFSNWLTRIWLASTLECSRIWSTLELDCFWVPSNVLGFGEYSNRQGQQIREHSRTTTTIREHSRVQFDFSCSSTLEFDLSVWVPSNVVCLFEYPRMCSRIWLVCSSTLEFDLSVRIPSNVLEFDFTSLLCLFEYPQIWTFEGTRTEHLRFSRTWTLSIPCSLIIDS